MLTAPWFWNSFGLSRGPLPSPSSSALAPSTASDIVALLSGIVAIVVALLGLDRWRRQMKGSTEYRIAFRALRAVFAVRDAIVEARRRPLPSEPEEQSNDGLGPQEAAVSGEAEAYRARLERVAAARATLLVAQEEAMAVWGEPAKEALEDLFRAVEDLIAACGQYFPEEQARARSMDLGGERSPPDLSLEAMRRVLLEVPAMAGRDPFRERIDRAVDRGEEFLRAKLG